MNYSQLDPSRYTPSKERAVGDGAYSYDPIRRHLPSSPEASILEIGCGGGALLACLRARGYANARGIDRNERLVAHGKAVLGLNIQVGDWLDSLTRDPQQYDAIIALDVLEHLEPSQIPLALSASRDRLMPGGRLILRAPNPACPLVLPMFYGDSTHRTMLADRLLVHLLREAGFAGTILLRETRPHNRWKRMLFLGAHHGVVRPILRGLYGHFYGNAPSVLTPNYYCFAYDR